MECFIGLDPHEARLRLTGLGFDVLIKEYVSKRKVEGACSPRVIRQRTVGNNKIELTVSYFKTCVDAKEPLS